MNKRDKLPSELHSVMGGSNTKYNSSRKTQVPCHFTSDKAGLESGTTVCLRLVKEGVSGKLN